MSPAVLLPSSIALHLVAIEIQSVFFLSLLDKMATADSKRSRKPNFKQEKLSVLVDEVEKSKTVILGKVSDTVSNERKKTLWISIATKCSAIDDGKRTAGDMRKIWEDWSHYNVVFI
jgi:hypothetical protein